MRLTPKEKAQELFDKYFEVTSNYYTAKDCALIAVDEMILFGDKIVDTGLFGFPSDISFTVVLKEVKKEIEAL